MKNNNNDKAPWLFWGACFLICIAGFYFSIKGKEVRKRERVREVKEIAEMVIEAIKEAKDEDQADK